MQLAESVTSTIWTIVYIIILFLLVLAIALTAALFKKRKNTRSNEYNLTFLQVKLPKDNEIEVKAAEHMFSNLMAFKRSNWKSLISDQYRISFEIVSKSEGIGFYVVVPDEISTLVEKQINAAYPSAEIDIVNPHEVWDRGAFTKVTELKLKGASFYPIKVYEDMKNDALSSITNSMSKMNDDEVLAVQYIVQPASDSWRMAGRNFLAKVKGRAADPEKKTNIDTAFLEGIEKKTSHPGFYIKVRVVSVAKDKITAESNAQNIISAFEQFTDINYNRFIQRKFISPKKVVEDFIYRRINVKDLMIPIFSIPIYSNVSVLNIVEMGTVFHFPNKDITTPNIIWLGARKSSAPVSLPQEGIYLGKSSFRGVEKEIRIGSEDRTRHFYIIGQTGTGKSELMMWMALQDIKNGEGVAIIDPHGTDIDSLLQKIPPERKNDVILFDAADTQRPLGLNMLEAQTDEERHMLINAFIALLYKLYDPNHQGIMGPILERSIRNVMLTAMTDPESTMIDVMRLLIDDNYYLKFLDRIKDPMVKRYWVDEMANTSKNRKGEVMGYIVSKFDRLVTDSTMRNIIGQKKSAFDFGKIMSEKKILLVDLAKGKIGEENSSFLGLLLVPRILTAALKRHTLVGKEDFPNFYLYVDEFQNFATPDFATILSEARKYKLNLTVGHQFIAQLEDDIKDAVFGNVGTICAFRVGLEDGEFLESQFSPTFTKQDLSNLPMGNAYIKLLVKGQPSAPFSMHTDWEAITESNKQKDPALAAEIRELSRQTYGMPVEEIEAQIMERVGISDEDKKVNPIPGFDKGALPF